MGIVVEGTDHWGDREVESLDLGHVTLWLSVLPFLDVLVYRIDIHARQDGCYLLGE
jgi:hypothetical protein